MSKHFWLTLKHNRGKNCLHLIRPAYTDFWLPQSLQPSPLSLDVLDKWHVQKSFHLYFKLENFLPHVSRRLPISISKGFNMNLLWILDILSSRAWCNTFISSHMSKSNTKKKNLGLQNNDFKNIFKGESSSIFIFYYVFHSRFSSPPTSFLLSIID